MKKRWYVISADDNGPDWDMKLDRTREFKTKTSAILRARNMAKDSPHCAFFVCETILAYAVETKPVQSVALN